MNFNFKKKYGQNFIIQKDIIKKIAKVIDNESPSLVVEVGCGDGRLTKELCNNYDMVVGYEIDHDLIATLIDNLKEVKNCYVICDDFLLRNVKEDVKKYNYENLYFIGNLPYYITTPIINSIIKSKLDVKAMVLMVQKEVGDRFCAQAGTKEYNSLTVYLNYYFNIKKEFIVGQNNFKPKPNVDSVVVSFKKKDNKGLVKNEELFFKLVKNSFAYKRKTLRNNLKDYDLDKIEEVLKKHNYDLSIRAEQLSLEIFIEIANNL